GSSRVEIPSLHAHGIFDLRRVTDRASPVGRFVPLASRNRRGVWKREIKGRAFIEFALSPGASAVAMDNPAHIGQANAGAFEFLNLVQALEYSKKFVRVLHVEACPVVVHGELPLIRPVLRAANLYPGPLPRTRVF